LVGVRYLEAQRFRMAFIPFSKAMYNSSWGHFGRSSAWGFRAFGFYDGPH
jgi:hypothetical protein